MTFSQGGTLPFFQRTESREVVSGAGPQPAMQRPLQEAGLHFLPYSWASQLHTGAGKLPGLAERLGEGSFSFPSAVSGKNRGLSS